MAAAGTSWRPCPVETERHWRKAVITRSLLLATALSFLALSPLAAETPTPPGAVYHSSMPAAERRVFFGELHLHTTMSFDAWSLGTVITPDQAYRFARGETVMVPAGQ